MTSDRMIFSPKWLAPDVRLSHIRKIGITGGVQVLPDGVRPLDDGRLFVGSGTILIRTWEERDQRQGLRVALPSTEVTADHQLLILLRDIADLRKHDRGDAFAAGKTEHHIIPEELPGWRYGGLSDSVKDRIRKDYPILERTAATFGEYVRDKRYR